MLCVISTEFFTHWGGSFRQERWCNYFLKRGYIINVLHCEPNGNLIQFTFTNSDDLRNKKADFLLASKPKAGVRSGYTAYFFRLLKHTFLLDVINPANLRLYYKLRKQILKLSNVQIVLHCSSPSFYLAIISTFLKIEFKKKIYFWLDMRDLWSLHTGLPGPKCHKRFIETIVLNKTDFVTTTADSLRSRFREKFSINAEVAYNVATHISFDDMERSKKAMFSLSPLLDESKITVTYSGSLPRGYYDLDLFAKWLRKFDSLIEIYENYQFLFIGECYELKSKVKNLENLSIVFIDQQKHEIVKSVQLNSDILLFFGFKSFDNQGQMSIKLFEYFETRNSILPLFVNDNSDIYRVIDLYCGKSLTVMYYDMFHQILIEYIKDREMLPRMRNTTGKEGLLRNYEHIVNEIEANLEETQAYV
ncbi:MAG: hypothetical protein RLZ10_47 [Bacteroidota bacterium]